MSHARAAASARCARGPTVAVTHESVPGDPLVEGLRAREYRVLEWTAVRTAPPEDDGPLARAVAEIESFDWVVLTSRRAASALVERRSTPPRGVRIAAVGSATAAALEVAGWPVSLVSRGRGAADLATVFQPLLESSARVLFPAGDRAPEDLAGALEDRVAQFVRVTAYRTLPAPLDEAACVGALRRAEVDALTFLSSSAVSGICTPVDAHGAGPELRALPALCIGPTTAEAARDAGFGFVREAATTTKRSVLDLVDHIVDGAPVGPIPILEGA